MLDFFVFLCVLGAFVAEVLWISGRRIRITPLKFAYRAERFVIELQLSGDDVLFQLFYAGCADTHSRSL